MASFVLLNDGSSFVLLNDGSSKLLLNDEAAPVTGVELVGTHAQAQIGDKRHSSQWTEVPQENTRMIDVSGKIKITITLPIKSKIVRNNIIISESKILRETVQIIKSKISKMNIREVKSRISSGITLVEVLGYNLNQHTDKLLKKVEKNAKLDNIKELFKQYRGINDEF